MDATDELRLPRVQARVLRQEVLDALRSGILANEIHPGSRLLEAEVASQMGVSRAPVREAIRQLEQEGLVEFFPHRGAVVVGLPEDEIDAIYEMRALIEATAMSRAVSRVSEAELESLREIIEDMRRALTLRDTSELAEVDLRFHGRIMEISGLTLLRRIWASVDGLVRVRSYQALDRPGEAARYFLEGSIDSHRQLVDVLGSGDGAAAAEAARRHILDVPQRLRSLPAKGMPG